LIHFYKRSSPTEMSGPYGVYNDDSDDEVDFDPLDFDENPEFNFDEERFAFDFDPMDSELFDESEDGNILMTYQALSKLAEMTAKILRAWEKRAANVSESHYLTPPVLDDDDGLRFQRRVRFLNLYQLERAERDYMRACSVSLLDTSFAGCKDVEGLRQKVVHILNFVRRVILNILSNTFPYPMPYPVMNTIMSYLLSGKGAVKIGLLSTDKSKEVVERKDMKELYLAMADVCIHMKVAMFNSPQPFTYAYFDDEASLEEKKDKLVEMFENLVATVKSSQLQIRFEVPNIMGVDTNENANTKEI